MQNLRYVFMDGSVRNVTIPDPGNELVLEREKLPAGLKHIDVLPEYFTEKTNAPGYLVLPNIEGSHHAAQTFFKERMDNEEVFRDSSIPLYGIVRKDSAVAAIVTGMRLEFAMVLGVQNGVYYLYPRFILDGETAYEDIRILFTTLTGRDATYVGMAKVYRKYQLGRNACRPLRERVKENPVLKEMCEGIEVRVRLAWKPVPSPVDDQTLETEPPVHCELTFKQAEKVIEEFHKQGIEHAEFCIVGWNISGHDGRFPDLFPVEPQCGTEEDLKALIEKAKSYGYLITGHTNLLEGYSIAKRFNREYALVQKDGSFKRGGNWGGGKSYYFCPKKAHEEYAEQDMKDMKRLGFRGAHYLDVFSIVSPDPCYHPEHPLNRKQNAEWRSKTLQLAREQVGASASEGPWDFCADSIDYVLYAAFFLNDPKPHPMCDKFIPLWFIVYHGILLYNGFADSVNANLKRDKTIRLWNYAWGGRPLTYLNSKFMSVKNSPWGNEDLRYESDEEFANSIAIVKKDYDIYRKFNRLQYEFIEDYEEIAEGILKTVYSDGTSMIFNLTENEFKKDGISLDAYSFIVKE